MHVQCRHWVPRAVGSDWLLDWLPCLFVSINNGTGMYAFNLQSSSRLNYTLSHEQQLMCHKVLHFYFNNIPIYKRSTSSSCFSTQKMHCAYGPMIHVGGPFCARGSIRKGVRWALGMPKAVEKKSVVIWHCTRCCNAFYASVWIGRQKKKKKKQGSKRGKRLVLHWWNGYVEIKI